MRIKLVSASLVDAQDPQPRPSAAVHIVNDRIEWVGPASLAPQFSAERIVDLQGGYLLPGLIESHFHLGIYTHGPKPLMPRLENAPTQTLYCMREAMNALKGGFTGLRTMGDAFWMDVAVRDAFKAGLVLGPRMWVSGEALIPSAGHCAGNENMWGFRICDGVDSWRRAAREQLQHHVDHIKLIITGGALGSEDEITGAITIVEEELQAVAQVAKSREKWMTIHAAADESVAMAIRAGTRSIEHGYFITDESVELLVKTGTYLTPTLSATHTIPAQLTDEYERKFFVDLGRAPWMTRRSEERFEPHRAAFQKALKAGVKLLLGADAGVPPSSGHCELAFMVRDGMSPWQAIVCATRNGAEAVGASDRLGTIEAGKYADLIAVAENPLEDIRRLREPKMVMKGGQFAVDQYGAEKLAAC